MQGEITNARVDREKSFVTVEIILEGYMVTDNICLQ